MSTQDLIEKEDSSRQLMEDCHELRRRLILTEESLRSLSSEQDTRSNLGDQTVSYERPQSASGFFLQGPSKAKLNLDVKQFDSPSRTASLPDINFSTRKMSAKHSMDSSQPSVQLHQMNEKISYMAQVIKEKDIQIRDLHFTINHKDSEVDRLNYDISIVNEKLREETRLRKSIEEKLRESLYAGEELQEQLIDLKNHIQLEKDKNTKEVNRKLLETEDDRRILVEQSEQLKRSLGDNESLRETNDLLHDELKLKNTLIEDIQKQLTCMNSLQKTNDEFEKESEDLWKRIETLQIENKELIQENKQLKAGKEDMKATIYAYEESLKQANHKLKTDEDQANSLSESPAIANREIHNRVPKISKAEFELKLAVKDAEIHKLQAALLSRAATNRKASSVEGNERPLEGSGLRSEFAAFLERSKAGDRKQQDLERIISQLEDDVAKYTDEIMVLEERLTDKLSYISLLEGKLEQKNSKMTHMQNEIKTNLDNKTELEKQLQSNSNEIQKKEKELQSYKERLTECTMQIGSFESAVSEKVKIIAHLEDAIKMNESEAKQASNLIEKIKSMNSENRQELQLQIDSLQEQLDIRNLELANLKANFQVLQQELEIKTSVCHDLETKLNETQAQLEERGSTLMTYEENLKKLSDSLTNETENVEHLQKALSECKIELKILVERAEKERMESINDSNKQRQQVDQLEIKSKDTLMKLEAKTNELNDALESLNFRDEELQNVKDRIRELERRKTELVEENQALTLKYQNEKSQLEKTLLDTKSMNDDLLSELSLQKKENVRLKVDLEEVQIRSGLEAERLEKLGKIVEKLDVEMKSQESLTRSFQSEAKEKELSNKALLNKFQELKNKLASEESLHHEASHKVKELEKELATVQAEHKQTVENLARLQLALIENEKEIQSKEETISIMDRKLKEGQENNDYKDKLLQEQSAQLSLLDKSMKEQQLELKQKAVEVTQLDMSMKDQHSRLLQRLNGREDELRIVTDELSERLTQLAELQAKIELTEEKLESKNSEMDNVQKTLQQQNKQLKEKTVAEAELQREINSLKSQLEDKSDLEQQLHSANEERSHMLADLVHLRTELSRKCQIEEELTGELDDCHVLLQAKEADCTRLAKNLGASQVREAEQEAKLMYELQKVRQNLELKNLRQQQEAEKASSEQSNRLAEKEKEIVSLQAKIQHATDESKVQKNDIERLRKRVSEQDNQIREMSNQLQQQQHYAEDLKENSLIKDAEIARLEARMSGYHRATRATYNDKLNKSYNL